MNLAWRTTAIKRLECMASGNYWVVGMRRTCWEDFCQQHRQWGWHAVRAELSRHAGSHLAAHVQHVAVAREMLGFWSHQYQKLRLLTSCPALPSGADVELVFNFVSAIM